MSVKRVEGLSNLQSEPLMELVEIQHMDGITIKGVPFVVWKKGQKPQRYDTKPNLRQNYTIKFVNEKSVRYKCNHFEGWTEDKSW